MPTFDDLALHSDCPVIHSQRKDGATLIATRIPLDDASLGRWGWVLTLRQEDGSTDHNDIQTLRDNSGRQYPKTYLFKDMKNYNETWSCTDWEEGYHTNGNASWLAKSNGVPGDKLVQENVFQQALTELQARQEEQLGAFQNQLLTQVATISAEVGANHTKLRDALGDITFNSHNRLLEQFRFAFEDTSKQLSTLDTETTSARQAQETALNEITLQTQKMHEDTKRDIEELREGIKDRALLVQDTIRTGFDQTHQDNVNSSETVKEGQQLGFNALTAHITVMQESIGKIWDAVNPVIDADTDATKSDNNDVASTAANAARKATSRIERMAANLTGLSNSYYKNVSDQSKRSFELARTISLIGGIILLVSLIAVFASLFLHLGEATLIFNGIGALIAAIVEGIAGLNLVYDKATKQFTRSQIYLDRIQRSSMAYAIAENIPDEAAKQQTVEKIALDLIKVGDQIKENEQAN